MNRQKWLIHIRTTNTKFLFIFVLLFSVTSHHATFLWLFQVKTWISIDICHGCLTFNVKWVEIRGDCWCCWYWWYYWPSLFNVQWVEIRGDCWFCWYWWYYCIIGPPCLSFLFIKLPDTWISQLYIISGVQGSSPPLSDEEIRLV